MPWQKDGQKDWRTEEWTDPILYDPSGYKPGVQKVKNNRLLRYLLFLLSLQAFSQSFLYENQC